ncbi:MAG TPA: hypothetical protein VES19_04435 [Candidatus Limnocylindrales bacterium]|nr:hypothetical protein [Candidatus Limnocylindrales bacterium]
MPLTPPPNDEDLDLDLDPREAARDRRRDHDTEAARRDLMRPGMGKVFKQITDSWAEKAGHEPRHGRRAGRREG